MSSERTYTEHDSPDGILRAWVHASGAVDLWPLHPSNGMGITLDAEQGAWLRAITSRPEPCPACARQDAGRADMAADQGWAGREGTAHTIFTQTHPATPCEKCGELICRCEGSVRWHVEEVARLRAALAAAERERDAARWWARAWKRLAYREYKHWLWETQRNDRQAEEMREALDGVARWARWWHRIDRKQPPPPLPDDAARRAGGRDGGANG